MDKIHVLSYLFLIENNNEANELFKKIIITVENELDDKNDKNVPLLINKFKVAKL